ncbi:MAG: DUF3311 domain-containing protein [Planctomycetales bacterium]|nr:DUF3311 domain-containing protein [Planctomycetales bacterium]
MHRTPASLGVWLIVMLLVILHQDDWFWENSTLVFGIVPIGLFYHACLSLAAAFTWFLATRYAWPLSESESRGDAA